MHYSPLVALTIALVFCAGATPAAVAGEETLEQRRERLERMSDVEKTRLLQKKRRFDELTPQDQDRLRKLQQQLSADPQCSHLRGVLERYSDWLRTLTPVERAELAKRSPEDRLAHVKQLVSAQDARRFGMMVDGFLSPKDLRAIRKWLDEFVQDHAAEILATVPDDSRFAEVKQSYDPRKHLMFLRFWYLRHDASSELPQPTKQDEERLRSVLSEEARKVLNKEASDDAERSRVIQKWMRAADFSSRVPPPVSQEELDRFVKEELSQSERAYLETLPRDRMYWELRSKYYQKRYGPGGRGGRWKGPSGARRGQGGPSGPSGPGEPGEFEGKPRGEEDSAVPPATAPPGDQTPDRRSPGRSDSGSSEVGNSHSRRPPPEW